MASGVLRLERYPGNTVEFACTKCDQRKRYRKAALIAIHGAHIEIRDLLVTRSWRMTEASALWLELFEKMGDVPFYATESHGGLECFFCGKPSPSLIEQ